MQFSSILKPPKSVRVTQRQSQEIEKNLILRFESSNVDWLHFVVDNRMLKPIDTDYDIIIRPVANDDVYETIIAFESGIYDEQETLKRLQVRNLFKEKGIFEYINDTFEAIHTLDSDFVVLYVQPQVCIV